MKLIRNHQFKNKFQCASVTDPEDIFDYFDAAEEDDECHTIIIDTLTFLMDQYESLYVVDSKNTQQAWGAYAQFFKSLIQDYAARSTKNIIILAHVADVIDNATGDSKTIVKVKGSIMNNGVESYFNNIVLARKVSTDVLKGVENDYLNITEKEKRLKSKYVFQTDKTKDTLQYRNRFPIDMWDDSELFIDNDICHVLERLIEFYGRGLIMGLLSKAAKNKKAKGETNYVGNAALDSNIYLCTIDNIVFR